MNTYVLVTLYFCVLRVITTFTFSSVDYPGLPTPIPPFVGSSFLHLPKLVSLQEQGGNNICGNTWLNIEVNPHLHILGKF